jgi:hypothetical protein
MKPPESLAAARNASARVLRGDDGPDRIRRDAPRRGTAMIADLRDGRHVGGACAVAPSGPRSRIRGTRPARGACLSAPGSL